jgi:CheY-like chemotaxis protein
MQRSSGTVSGRRGVFGVLHGSAKPCVGERKHQAKAHYTLLWIDDFAPGLGMYKAMFEALGFRVLTASNGEEGVRLAQTNYLDAVVTDYEMPGMDGEAVCLAIKTLRPGLPILLFSGSTLISARCRRVVDECCDKAGSREELLAAIHRLLDRKRPPVLQPPIVAQASHHGHRTVA